ncbi:MAG: alpha/beta fold hydrolase [Flavobacteriaceae bacterium]|nr:alpha/beta fold hydrolase [Flavobacteriaceae bacterium]
MPLLENTYHPSPLLRSGFINTVYRTFTSRSDIRYQRKRITTTDNDFLDIDFVHQKTKTIVIILHGLEGSSQSAYIKDVVHYLASQKIAVAALNFRSCGGEDNLKLQSYHSGKTDDLATTIRYISDHFDYSNISLLGFSMGGNIVLKYVGETLTLNGKIQCAMAVSVPCDLTGSSIELSKKRNYIFMQRFLRSLKKKTFKKLAKHPTTSIQQKAVKNARNFLDFDGAVTAPLFGFNSAQDYWNKNSCKPFLTNIKIPTLLINALDDSFLSKSCHPFEIAKENKYFNFMPTTFGGHVGFNHPFIGSSEQWLEKKLLQFLKQHLKHDICK